MVIPLLLIIFTMPALLYLAVHRRRGGAWSEGLVNIGWQWPQPVYWLWGMGVFIIMGILGGLAICFVPADILQDPNLNVSAYAGMSPTFTTFLLVLARESIYVALGEEIFFRGWLGGWLVRRFGFAAGNMVQAICFLLPHLLLLTISVALWPLTIVQFVAGWLLGWLRHRSGSILPGWLVHSLTNALAALWMISL
jgi:uncharacterized protein